MSFLESMITVWLITTTAVLGDKAFGVWTHSSFIKTFILSSPIWPTLLSRFLTHPAGTADRLSRTAALPAPAFASRATGKATGMLKARPPLFLTVAMTADEPGFDGDVRLFGFLPQWDDPYQPYELANHDDIDATHLDPLLQPYIVEPGTYTVSASHSQNPAFSPTDGSSGRPSAVGGFDLAIILLEALTPDGAYETEDVPCISADSILESTPSELAGPGSASFTASIGDGLFGAFRGDVDFYQLPPVLDERLEIDVSPTGDPASLIPVVHLYDDIGTHLASWTADQTGVVHGTFERRCRGFTGPLDPDSPVEYAAVMGAKDRSPMDPFAGVTNLPDGTSPRPDPAPLSAIDGSPGGGRSKPATADTAIGRCLTTVWA